MRIFVAGSACVVGRLLLPKLVHEGHEVIEMTHKEENMAGSRYILFAQNIRVVSYV